MFSLSFLGPSQGEFVCLCWKQNKYSISKRYAVIQQIFDQSAGWTDCVLILNHGNYDDYNVGEEYKVSQVCQIFNRSAKVKAKQFGFTGGVIGSNFREC